ncbi:MAG TPA: hypothetical protein VMV44_06355 [Rectinemataceae bacterium]|nr:hypothetical protein [Rectinemataceae bacterium]
MNKPTTIGSRNAPTGEGRDDPRRPDPTWRLVAAALPLSALLLLPLPERPLAAWMVLFPVLAASRIVSLRERLSGLEDLLASLPFLALAIVGLYRFSPGPILPVSLEALTAIILIAMVPSLLPPGRSRGRWALGISTLPLLGLLAFVWSLDRPLEIASSQLILALLIGSATRGRRPT